MLLVATLQGIAALITSGRADPKQTDALIADTVALFTRTAGREMAKAPPGRGLPRRAREDSNL